MEGSGRVWCFEGQVRGFAGRVDWMWRAREKEQNTQLWRKPLLLPETGKGREVCQGGGRSSVSAKLAWRQLARLVDTQT